jgi:hypothetical protein
MGNLRWGLSAVLLTFLSSPVYGQSTQPPENKSPAAKVQKKSGLDPKADQVLKEMSNYFGNLPSFSVETKFTQEVITKAGEKLNFDGSSQVLLDRRFGIRADRTDAQQDVSLFYDKKTLSVFRRGSNFYASANAPSNLDKALDFMMGELNLDTPAADLLYSNPYAVLTDGAKSSEYLGVEEVNGELAHHVAVRGDKTDIQVWVKTGDKPLPVKYVITTKDVEGIPQFAIDLTGWDVAPLVSPDMFTFTPPPGAERIEFKSQLQRRLSQQQTDKKRG